MEQAGNWIMGFAGAVMGVAALFVAAHSGEGLPYYGGIAFFVFAMLFVFMMIKVSFDHRERPVRR